MDGDVNWENSSSIRDDKSFTRKCDAIIFINE